MTPEVTEKLLRRFYRSIRKAWLKAIRMIDTGSDVTEVVERFANSAIALAVEAGQREARHLRTGAIDLTSPVSRFRVGRGTLVTRFLSDVSPSRGGMSAGLSARQVADLRTYRAVLEGTPPDTIDYRDRDHFIRMQVRALETRMVSQRADLIARMLAGSMLHIGIEEAVDQSGDTSRIARKWNTAGDEKVRSSHSAMSGQIRLQGLPFVSGNGNPLMHPHDPNASIEETANCRCFITTEIRHG